MTDLSELRDRMTSKADALIALANAWPEGSHQRVRLLGKAAGVRLAQSLLHDFERTRP